MTTNGTEKRPLPDGWTWTTIGEVTESIEKVKPQDEPEKEFTYLDISGIDNTRNVIAEPKVYYGAEAPSRARQSVKAGDVLFSTVRTYLKNIAQVPEIYDGQVASTGFSILRGQDKVSNKYLFYYSLTDSFLTPLGELQRGSSYPAVRDRDVREQLIPLAPLPEQERIVAEIEKQLTRLDQAVASLRRLQSNLARYKASVLKAACEGRLVPQDPNDEPAADLLARILAERRAQWQAANPGKKYQEPVGVEEDTAVLPALPDGWAWASIEQLASEKPRSIQSGPFGSNLLHSEFQDTGMLAIGIDNVLEMQFSMGRQNRISPEKYEELRKYKARPLDVVITVMATVGRCCVLPENIENAIITKHVYRISVNQTLVDPYYLMYSLSGGDEVRRQMFGNVRGQTRPGINGTILKKLAIPIPPLAEQERIVAEVERRLSVVTAVEQTITANLSRAERLRQSILHRAFTGQL